MQAEEVNNERNSRVGVSHARQGVTDKYNALTFVSAITCRISAG